MARLGPSWEETKQDLLLKAAFVILIALIFSYKAVKSNWINEKFMIQASLIMVAWANWRLIFLCPVDLEKGDLAIDDIVLPYPDDYVEPEHVLHRW